MQRTCCELIPRGYNVNRYIKQTPAGCPRQVVTLLHLYTGDGSKVSVLTVPSMGITVPQSSVTTADLTDSKFCVDFGYIYIKKKTTENVIIKILFYSGGYKVLFVEPLINLIWIL